jgi:SAM-dependent methyltransferase
VIPAILDFARAAAADFGIRPTRVLEIGSLDVNGSVRSVFPGVPWVGIDRVAGRGVDVVMDGRESVHHYGHGAFDLVVCCEALEHDPRPWEVWRLFPRLLRPGGFLLVSTPTFGFGYHGYPKDYWRPSEDAYREVIFEGLELLRLATLLDVTGAPCICGVGRA